MACTSSRSPRTRRGSGRVSAVTWWRKPNCWRDGCGSHGSSRTTTNDNLPALYFYQRRGYRMTALVPAGILAHTHDALNGFGGIPVRDEVHLEKLLS